MGTRFATSSAFPSPGSPGAIGAHFSFVSIVPTPGLPQTWQTVSPKTTHIIPCLVACGAIWLTAASWTPGQRLLPLVCLHGRPVMTTTGTMPLVQTCVR